MPMFEYSCRACGHRFEAIVQRSTTPDCPECKSRDLVKELSLFAVGGTPSFEAAPRGCGTCGDPRGPGACATRDRA